MDFAMVTAYQPVEELLPLARAADEAGFRAMSVADHVVDLEELATPYPYTADGARRWSTDVDWPDPWVTIGALGAVTERLEFFTSIYVAALRDPFSVAKAVGTASALTGGRVRLGVGVGWCREEFELMGQDFTTRGRRTDEALTLMRSLWSPGWTEFASEHYACERLVMRPHPPAPIPIWVGGLSDVALRRAARHDGWVGDMASVDEAIKIAGRLIALRAEAGVESGLPSDPAGTFEIVPALTDAYAPDDFLRAAAAGVTMTMTVPWMYYPVPASERGEAGEVSLRHKIAGIHRYAEDVIAPVHARR